jgi:branched-chain amino acid aminotransferase
MTLVYLDGAFIAEGEARVAATGVGVLFGRGVFETMRAREGRVFRLDAHVDRMRDGARVLGIDPPDADAVAAAAGGLVRRLGLDDARVRATLAAGPPGGRPSLLVQARPATDYPADLYERGMTAVLAAVRRNETSPLSRVKSLNCLDNVLARDDARDRGAGEALLLNTRGLIAEGSVTNVFAVTGGGLVTPPLGDGALPGVTRAVVLDVARASGLAATERSLTPQELRSADEAFLTNAVMGVMPLVSVDGSAIGAGQPGETTRAVMSLYAAAVAAC